MAEYRYSTADTNGGVIREWDGASIPPDPANRDYAEYLVWVENGGITDPYIPLPEPPPYVEPGVQANSRLDAGIQAAVDPTNKLDAMRKARIAIPPDSQHVTQEQFAELQAQVDQLEEAVTEMLKAQTVGEAAPHG